MKISSYALAPVALLLVSSITLAHDVALPGTIEVPAGNGGYVSVGGNALRTAGGECLRLGGFSEDTQIDACEGIEAAEEEVVAEAPAPEPAAAPTPEPVAKEPIVSTATLGGEALFDSGSAELIPASEQALATLLTQLDKFQEITSIDVTGHTDSQGAEAYNQGLSEQRAQSVQAFLQAAYPDVQITAGGDGESNPVATNSTPEGRQLNRRVEIRITAKSIIDA